ncbi:hypothetical protein [Geodermatophilus marinus]|uniref:hypothetical protein n=1 Tax=Geodermatophilus sp. LHW52908 TaxID=2303986 RepID=UPI0011C1569E|nr:hypothetical protein [Geodermatophilus sp. LHW52908]
MLRSPTRRDADRHPDDAWPPAPVPREPVDGAPRGGAAPPPGRRDHWSAPDPLADILAFAWQPGAAPPREIRIRPETLDRLLARLSPSDRARLEQQGVVGGPAGVPLVVDGTLPASPGFEVVRVPPAHLVV